MFVLRHMRKRFISLILLCSFMLGLLIQPEVTKAKAATTYVTRAEMIRMILVELGIKVQESDPIEYITQAKKIGLITSKSFSDYDKYINKAETAMLLVRADEYLYGKTVDDNLMNKIIECRISDISKLRTVLRPYLAKAYALGYIMGTSNGTYSTNRKFNPTYKITKKYATTLVSMLHNKDKRHQISPDGQLLRTTKLPKMAEFYPYILASYPNSYYDWQFLFMRTKMGDELVYGTDKWVSKVDYAAPVDFMNFRNGERVFSYYYSHDRITPKELYDECIDKWEENARSYLECVFNVNYKTIKQDKDWLEKFLLADFNGVNDREQTIRRINIYMDNAVKNQVTVESSIIAVDRSSIYLSNGAIYMRVFVKYRINSSKTTDCTQEFPIIYTRFINPGLNNLVIGEWRECYASIQITGGVPNYGVENLILNDEFHDVWVVDL